MNWVVAYSLEQTGFDGLAEALALRLNARFVDVDAPDAAWPGADAEAVLLLNGLKWFMHNRLSIPGRPWVCAASFCFEDLRHLIELNSSMADTGIHVLFSNCAEFVRHVSAAMSAKFCWKPLAAPAIERESNESLMVGTVLPNILDRDFSQVLYTYRAFKAAGAEERFVVAVRGDEKMRLPAELQPAARTYLDIADVFYGLDYFVPAPRINDYRVGIVPSEIIWAAQCGCVPLLIYHPLMETLERSGFTLEKSLRSYDVTINMLAAHADMPVRRVEMPEALKFTVDQFVDDVKVAHARWRANA